MIDGSEKRNRQLAFELQNSHVCEKCSNKQNNNFASASHFFVHFFAVTARLRRENA